MTALDEIAQQISEERSITLVDSATTHPGAGAAAPLAAWLAQRADELRAADDAQVLDDICRRDASAAPTTAEVDATAATTAEALRAEIVGEAPTEGQAPRHAVHTAQPRGRPPMPTVPRPRSTSSPRPPHPSYASPSWPSRTPQTQRQRRAAHGVPPAAPQRALRGHRGDGRAAPPARGHVQRGHTHGRHHDGAAPPPSRRDTRRRPARHHTHGARHGRRRLVDARAARRGLHRPTGIARYRAGAAAIAKVDSYMQPTGDTPHSLRWGVRAEAAAHDSAADAETAETGLEQRLQATAAEAKKLQAVLEATRPSGDGDGDGYAEFACALSPYADTEPGDTLPPEMLTYKSPAPPADVALPHFRHTAVIFPTQPLPDSERLPPNRG